MSTPALPNVVIAGAPKCGTGSFFHWLAAHPRVCSSQVKETCYLMDRDSPLLRPEANVHDHGLEGYARLFAHGTGQDLVTMEATPDYIYQDTAREVLSRMDPAPMVLFLLRRPSERVHSAWRFFSGHKAAIPGRPDFAAFVRRLLDGPPYTGRLAPLVNNAIVYSRYSSHLRAWRESLPAERIRLYLFEDMRRDPGIFMRAVCRDIGLDQTPYRDFDFRAHNVSYAVRSRTLHRMRNLVEPWLPRGRYRRLTSAMYRMVNWNRGGFRQGPEVPATLAALDRMLADETDILRDEFGLDTSPWRSERSNGSAG